MDTGKSGACTIMPRKPHTLNRRSGTGAQGQDDSRDQDDIPKMKYLGRLSCTRAQGDDDSRIKTITLYDLFVREHK